MGRRTDSDNRTPNASAAANKATQMVRSFPATGALAACEDDEEEDAGATPGA
jgi:hypothetical protein